MTSKDGDEGRSARRRWIGVAVVVVWLVATGLLVRREGIDFGTDDASLTGGIGGPRTSSVFFGVFAGGRRVGHVHLAQRPEPRDGEPGQRSTLDARLDLPLMGKQTDLDIEGDVWRPDAPRIARRQAVIEFTVRSSDHDFRLEAELAAGALTGQVRSAGESLPIQLPVGDDVLIENGLGTSLSFPHMAVGETLRFTSFDPLTMSPGRARVRCVAEDTVRVGDEDIPAKVLEVQSGGMETRAWIDAQGGVLRAETPLGLELRQMTAAEALAEVTGSPDGVQAVDWLGQTAIVPTGTRPMRGAERLVLRLDGVDVTPPSDPAQQVDGRMVEIRRVEVTDPATDGASPASSLDAYLLPDAFVQSDHPTLVDQARAILVEAGVGDDASALDRARAIHEWVFVRLDKEPVVSIPSALEVLRQGKGDCNEHTVLFAALARAVGVPTKIAIGLVWSDELGGFYYHAWPEVHVAGGWLRMDPTLDQPVADATHLKLLEGGIETWPRLLSYLGRLRIEVLEMTPPGGTEDA